MRIIQLNSREQQALDILMSVDGYKLSHKEMYKKGTKQVISNLTPRIKSFHPTIKDEVIVFGLKYVITKLQEKWEVFFNLTKKEVEWVINEYQQLVSLYLGTNYNVDHLRELYNYGRLPLNIYGLSDYTKSPLGNPVLTLWNTDERFFWLVNYIETYISASTWQIITSATIVNKYREIINKYGKETSSKLFNDVFINYQLHDFSMRGMSSVESATLSGLGHLSASRGTDTLMAVSEYEKYFDDKDYKYETKTIMSVPASEHSVMCSGGKENERETYLHIIKDAYPNGIVSIVSDTWDYWNVLTNILPSIKEDILSRNGKLVIRPDSGDPETIIVGSKKENPITPEEIGTIRLLDETFGHTINEKGYKVLNNKIGIIYGDAITLERAESILSSLKELGYASENIVFGIGSFTYQYNTRDTFGFAIKATAIVDKDNKVVPIFKDPVTDKSKKSAKGIVNVFNNKIEEMSTLEAIENPETSDFKLLLKDGVLN